MPELLILPELSIFPLGRSGKRRGLELFPVFFHGGEKVEIRLLQIKESSGMEITSPESVTKLMKEESKADRGCLWILHLNTKNRIIEKELVSMGILDSSLVSPREVFKKAIINSANSIIAVHNHPSGLPDPSKEDRQIIEQLSKAGEILCIPLMDFIIISSSGKYWSAKENGWHNPVSKNSYT